MPPSSPGAQAAEVSLSPGPPQAQQAEASSLVPGVARARIVETLTQPGLPTRLLWDQSGYKQIFTFNEVNGSWLSYTTEVFVLFQNSANWEVWGLSSGEVWTGPLSASGLLGSYSLNSSPSTTAVVTVAGTQSPDKIRPEATSLSPGAVPPQTAEQTSLSPGAVPPQTAEAISLSPGAVPPQTAEAISLSPGAVPPQTAEATSLSPGAVPPQTAEATSLSPGAVLPQTAEQISLSPGAVPPQTAEAISLSPSAVPPQTAEATSLSPGAAAEQTAEPSLSPGSPGQQEPE